MFYRPLFTCGASYGDNTIVYNTSTNMSYYFDGITAQLMQLILDTPREARIDTEAMANKLLMSTGKIEAFMQSELMPEGLVADHLLTDDEWKQFHTDHPFDGREYKRNISAIEMEYDSHLPAEKKEIYSAMLELTYACSERCIHCYNEGAARSDMHEEHRLKPGQLGIAEYRDLIDQLAAEGIRNITVTGGDPFSHPDCWEILEYLSQKNFLVALQTNALALNTPEKIRRVAHLGISHFAVTLYSADPTVHDSITRRQGSFERTLATLEEVAKWPIGLEIKCPVFKINARTYFGIHRISERLNAGENMSMQLVAGTDGDTSVVEQLNMDHDTQKVVMQDKWLKNGYQPTYEYKVPELEGKSGLSCSAYNSLSIGPTGNVSVCALMTGSLGNVRRQPLHDIIFSEARRIAIKRPRTEMFAKCGKEPYCQYCKQICVASERMRTDGTSYEPNDSFCESARIRMEVALADKAGNAPLEGEALEKALLAMPVQEVPVFKKKI